MTKPLFTFELQQFAEAPVCADPGYRADQRKRFSIGTAEEVKAASALVAKASVRSNYTAEQLVKIDARIDAAAKKFGVQKAAIETVTTPATTQAAGTPVTIEAVKALIDVAIAEAVKAVQKAAPIVDLAPVTALVTALDARVTAEKAVLETQIGEAKAAATASETKATAAEARAIAAETVLAGVVGKAKTATSPGGDAIAKADGTVTDHPATGNDVTKAAPPATPSGLSPMAAAIHAQRYATT